MAQDKKGFLLYADNQDLINKLPDEIAGRLLKHIFAYVNDENPQTNDLLLDIAFEPIKQQLKRDLIKYEQTKEKRSEAGKKSAEVKKQNSTKSTSVENVKQTSTKSTDKDSVTDNVNVKVNDINIPTTSVDVVSEFNNSKNIEYGNSLKNLGSEWIDNASRILKIKPFQIISKIDDFNSHLSARFTKHQNKKSYVEHFMNWAPDNIKRTEKPKDSLNGRF